MLHSLFPMTREVVCHPDPTDQTLLSQPGNNNVRNWGKERWGWLEQEIIRYFSGQYLIKSLKSISTSLPSLKYFSLLLLSLLIFVLTTGYLSASHTEIYTPRLSQAENNLSSAKNVFKTEFPFMGGVQSRNKIRTFTHSGKGALSHFFSTNLYTSPFLTLLFTEMILN